MLDEPLLMIPGPTHVSTNILKKGSLAMVNHRAEELGDVLVYLVDNLKTFFGTEGKIFVITGSGTASLDAAISNTLEPRDKVLCLTNGKFGERLIDIVKRTVPEKNITIVKEEYGRALTVDKLENIKDDFKLVTIVHNETSTGVLNPVEDFGNFFKNTDTLLLVDSISGLGGTRFNMSKFNIDITITGTQKCFGTPPGLSFVAINDKAWEYIKKAKHASYYLDLKYYWDYFCKSPPQTPFTPAISVFFMLKEAIERIKKFGIEKYIKKHEIIAEAVRSGLKAINLELFAQEGYYSNTVTSVKIPVNIDVNKILKGMKSLGIIISPGQAELVSKIFRVGHMGFIDHKETLSLISTMEIVLNELGHEFSFGQGVITAMKILSKNLDLFETYTW